MDLSQRDATREGDGLAMLAQWRINMLEFFDRHHNKYLILGHRLLAGKSLLQHYDDFG